MATKGVNKVILVGNIGQDPEVRSERTGADSRLTRCSSNDWRRLPGPVLAGPRQSGVRFRHPRPQDEC